MPNLLRHWPSPRTGLVVGIVGAVVVTVLVVLVATVIWRFVPTTPESDVATRLAGERWYAVTFRHTPIGHYQATAGRTDDGDFEFRTVLRFRLEDNAETRMEDRLVFHRRPPHRLLLAEHSSSGDGSQTRVSIAEGTAEVIEAGTSRRTDADSDLELADYLAVESWLARVDRQPGETQTARSVDFDALAITTDHWRIVGAENGEVEIVNESSVETARIRLDAELRPLRMESGDLLTLQRVADENAARIWERSPALFGAASHRVPVDRAIARPESLSRLVVAVDHEHGDEVHWLSSEGTGLLAAQADPRKAASADDIGQASGATVSFPAGEPRMRDLAKRAVASLDDPGAKANALTMFVHHHLRYRDTAGGRTVFDTVRDRSGDCTEFADLYTTLARATGLPARTVIGLAYQKELQSFALHAWNEVAIDGFWRSVDPTWGQTSLDATHFALPAGDALAAITELPHLSFRIVETLY